jgi:dTMP kinase
MSKLPEEKWDGFLEWLEDYEYNRLGLPKPDKVIFLDMPLEISRRLISSRYGGDETKRDIHEADAEYLRKCRLTALYSAKKCGWKIIDCSNGDEPLPVDVIFNKLVDEISDLIYQNLCS